MVRTPCCDKSGLRKGTWTPEEDRKLIAYVTRYGCWNWRQLPRFAGLARCGKSCRLRWLNYLRPNIKRGNFTQEEEETIIKLHHKLGNRWSAIAAEFPGRTDNDIKNHWHSNLKKRYQHNSTTVHENGGKVSESKDVSQVESQSLPIPNINNASFQSSSATNQIGQSCPLSPQSSSSELSCITTETTAGSNENLVMEDEFAFLEAMNGNFWTEPYVADISYVPLPPLPTESQYFSPLCGAELWSPNNLYDEYAGLF